MLRDEIRIPAGAVLGNAPLIAVINVDQAEPVVVSGVPFQIIGERPVEISLHRDAVCTGTGQLLQVGLQKIDAVGVVDLSVPVDPVMTQLADEGLIENAERQELNDLIDNIVR